MKAELSFIREAAGDSKVLWPDRLTIQSGKEFSFIEIPREAYFLEAGHDYLDFW